MLYTQAPKATRTWVDCPQPRPDASVKLICLPHAGASPRAFYPWVDDLPESVELMPVCLAGRAGRMDEPLAESIEKIVAPLARAVSPLIEGRVVFFGHSLGALLAVELVFELRRRGLRLPQLLVVSGRMVPGAERRLKVHTLPDRHLVREVQRIYGGIPREILVEPAMLKRTLPILRADLSVNETYEPAHQERPLECSLLALGGTDDPHVTGTELEMWRDQTTAHFDCAQFQGGHFYLSSPEGQRWVIARIMRAIEAVSA
ncbi:thioesterase [Pseudenhygromyxa sp. WMMC2535]|uniref:thioesterase II family protein n=1 Tax=Pseudenhygromyxa sp. WMMC2535 TaxID=2712867 RepID=UPI001552D6F1|nr:thioesterase [Pseudenhygromyxa sp. WMMC2535]NVB42934.1 thioesterase [Pseudenhygromyxa sp. WMMC2535]